MMGAALPTMAAMGNGETLFLTVAAGTPIATYEAVLGAQTPVIRAMPNTPAAVGRGISAIIGNAQVTPPDGHRRGSIDRRGPGRPAGVGIPDGRRHRRLGLGPAYVFHLIETLAAAGEAEGLSPDLALHLARATVAGAGALAEESDEGPGQLRRNVTSPNGTTQAALEVLMDEDAGFPALMRKAVARAAARSRELARG